MRERALHLRGSYLRDAVFAASDGIITTFAVVAGSTGADLNPIVVVILGFANIFADGFSMSSGTYLGVKSEMEFEKAEGDVHISEASPFKQALVAFVSFVLAGIVPLAPYILNMKYKFEVSMIFVFIIMFLIGVVRGKYTKKNWLRSGLETFLVGGIAAMVAFITGYIIENFILS